MENGKRVRKEMGAGGRAMQDFLASRILPRLADRPRAGLLDIADLDDAAVVDGVALTTDSHTVWPLVFPGGSIGSLSVAGTVNDLCMVGARPAALTLALVIEEGLDLAVLDDVLDDTARTAKEAGVPIVTGDTKVVEKGGVKGMVANTAGIGFEHPRLRENAEACGRPPADPWLRDSGLRGGEDVIVTGTLGDHGFTVLSQREGLRLEGDLRSDIAPLNGLADAVLAAGGVVAMKDPTRGGLANLLNEWAEKSGVEISVDEAKIPVSPAVRSASALLGIDPLEVGNEGKAVIATSPDRTDAVLEAIRAHPLGAKAEVIGKVGRGKPRVLLRTATGGRRLMEPPFQDPIPRIC